MLDAEVEAGGEFAIEQHFLPRAPGFTGGVLNGQRLPRLTMQEGVDLIELGGGQRPVQCLGSVTHRCAIVWVMSRGGVQLQR